MHSPKLFPILAAGILFVSAGPLAAHEWMAPEEAAGIDNPVTADQASITKGKALFMNNCASCHGPDARGMSAEEAGLSKAPSNLVKRLANHNDGDFFWKIENGRGDMPSFEGVLEEKEIWDIINFIKTREISG